MMRIDSYEQFGGVTATSDWVTIDQSMIDQFARVTGDEQWIHVDPARARAESPIGATIAHGFLTLSLLSRLAFNAIDVQLGQSAIINYGLNKVRFPAPTRVDARIRGVFALKERNGDQLVWSVTVEAEGIAKPVCVAEWVWLIQSRR
ncbi:MAG: MaoC family dehydratase [Acidobacteria bacterium]|nr:MaoC family dehydratase [Acidobacteriota bacterium]